MTALRALVLTVAMLAVPADASAEAIVGGFGVLHYRSTSTLDTPLVRYDGSVTGFGLAGSVYALAPSFGGYVRITWNLWGTMASWGDASQTEKGNGTVVGTVEGSTQGFTHDAFLLFMPRIDLGYGFGPLPIKPSIGITLKDGWLKGQYYSIDPGITLGLLMGLGSKAAGVVVFPTATFFVSGYNEMDGGGTGRLYELSAAIRVGPVWAEVRLGSESRDMAFRRFDTGETDVDVLTKDRSFKLMVGGFPPGLK